MNTATDLEQPAVVEAQWVQDAQAAVDTWNRRFEPGTYSHASQYPESINYFWQAVRGDFRLSGIAVGREGAMKQAEEIMALPVEEFNRRVCANLIDELRKIERDILLLSPGTEILPGYHAGYEAGAADVKRRVAAAIDLGDEGQS